MLLLEIQLVTNGILERSLNKPTNQDIEQANKPRSYNVLNDHGHTIQRNRKDLKLSLNQPTIQDEGSLECFNPSSIKANRNTSNMRLGNINDPPLRHQPV
ncbi:hypothetical protein QE152_g583 [Popillia japonica]|uniref:Uncharacterized protein n=1 Tax=Popillia japonica TaxID=7064 RepID=A0AAW1NIM0_POPJA